MANKYSGFSAKLQISISATFTDIAGIRDITGPGMKQNAINVSSRDSAWEEFVAGMKDGGEIKFDCVYDPDTPTHSATVTGGFIKQFIAGTTDSYKLLFADTSPLALTFSGIVTNIQTKAPYNGMQAADVTIKVTGAITAT